MKHPSFVIPLILAFATCTSLAAPETAAAKSKEQAKEKTDGVAGTVFKLRIQPPHADENGNKLGITKEQVDLTFQIIQKRLDAMGVAEWRASAQGDDSILLQLPDVKPDDSQAIRKALEKVGKLELREVSTRNDDVLSDEP